MKQLKCYLPQAEGTLAISDEPLGRGGEGSVYSVDSHDLKAQLPPADQLVAKIYHEPQEHGRGPKIAAMIKHTPESESLAWPLAIVATQQGAFQGYLMKKLPMDTYRMWAEFANTKQRRQSAKGFDVQYALTAALNLALTLDAVHGAGHRVGDVNESNIFIGNDASVLLVDTDSAQVETPKAFYPCLVGKPEYTAPEISHGALKEQKRTVETDVFAYSVAVYQLLVGGAHPTDAVFEGEEDPPSTMDKIRKGIYPNLNPPKNSPCKPVPRIAAAALPTAVKTMLLQGLSVDPKLRPSLHEIAVAFDSTLDHLVQCKKMKFHWYDSRDKKCGWCAHVKAGNPDPWAPMAAPPKKQKTLNPIKLQKEDKSPGATRAPRAQIGSPMLHGGGSTGAQQLRQTMLQQAAQTPKNSAQNRGQHQKNTPQQQQYNAAALANYPPISNCYPSKRVSLKKNKKNVSLLNYSDGTVRPRPSLKELASSDGKLAWECFVNELPTFLRLSWPFNKTLPTTGGMLFGVLMGLTMAFFWLMNTPEVFMALGAPAAFPYSEAVYLYGSIASAATSSVAIILRWFFTRREIGYLEDHVGNVELFPKEKPLATGLKFSVTSLVYGPLFLVGLVVTLFYLILQGLMRELANTK